MVSQPAGFGGAIAQGKQILYGNILGGVIPVLRAHRQHRAPRSGLLCLPETDMLNCKISTTCARHARILFHTRSS
jgi:hypothetical protein